MSLPFLQPYFGLSNSLQTAQASAGGGGVGGWVELGRTTLGSAASTITVSSLPDKRFYKVLTSISGESTNSDVGVQFNSDTGSSYARRLSYDGNADVSTGSLTESAWYTTNTGSTTPIFCVHYIANYSTKEKLFIGHGVRQMTAGAGTAPARSENVGKWANTSNSINSITARVTSTFNSGSEVVVLGWDPADTHTTNFWTELASVQGTASSQILSSGTITAKKYLWIQGFTGDNGGGNNSAIQFNNDTATNYATRRSLDGGADDSSWTNQAYAQVGTNSNCFFNYFIINNSANEKLCIGHFAQRSTAGAGTAPGRGEFVCKWANTSAQITEIDLMQQTTTINWGTDVYMKVWGSN